LTGEQLFLERVSELNRWKNIKEVRGLIINTLALTLILNSVALGVQKTGLFDWGGLAVYPLLSLMALALALLLMSRARKTLLRELIEIESRFELKERLSTAYEYIKNERKSIFLEPLLDDAYQRLDSLDRGRIFPGKTTPGHILILVFSAAIIILLSMDSIQVFFQPDKQTRKEMAMIGSRLKSFSERELERSEKEKTGEGHTLLMQMKKLGQELEEHPMRVGNLKKSLGALKKEAEFQSDLQATRLEAELSLGDVSGTPLLKPLKNKDMSRKDLNQVKKELQKVFEGRIPASISREIDSLDRSQRAKETLAKALAEAGRLEEQQEKSDEPGASETAFIGGLHDRGDSSDAKPDEARDRPEGAGERGERPPILKRGDRETGSSDDDRRPSREDVYTAGQDKPKDEKLPPKEIEGAKGLAQKDITLPARGQGYQVQVRSLPLARGAQVAEEDLIKSYEREIEEVLHKETIPKAYREYIKKYFISIGLRNEQDEQSGN